MAEQLNNLLLERCIRGSVEEVRQTLEAGADPNAMHHPPHPLMPTLTCLLGATWQNHDRVVELLLSTPGIQVNAKNIYGNTALHWACYHGSATIIAMLASSPGVQLNERNNYGETPIMFAIQTRQTPAVLQMASLPDVDLDVKDNEGRSLEEYATWLVLL